MNLQTDRTIEAEAELQELMEVEKNFLSPQNGKPCMGSVQDNLLGARLVKFVSKTFLIFILLTDRNVFLNRAEFMNLVIFSKNWNGIIPIPTILKPLPLWTGKQVISSIIPKINYVNYAIDFPTNEKNEDISPVDSKVLIKDGELLMGHFCKKTGKILFSKVLKIFFCRGIQ